MNQSKINFGCSVSQTQNQNQGKEAAIYYGKLFSEKSFIVSMSRRNYMLVCTDIPTAAKTQNDIITYRDKYQNKIIVCKDRILICIGLNQYNDVSFEKTAIEYQDKSPLELENALIDQCKYIPYVNLNCVILYVDQETRPTVLSFRIGPSEQRKPAAAYCQFVSNIDSTFAMGNHFCTTVTQNIQVPAPDFALSKEQQINKDVEWLHNTFDKIVEFSANVNMPSTVSKLSLMYLLDNNGTKKIICI